MNARQFVNDFELLSSLADRMRQAANRSEWENLIGLERQFKDKIAAIKPVDEQPDDACRQQMMDLIKKILEDDADIRSQTDLWMNQLQRIMQSNRQEQRLNQAYGAM